MIDHHDPDHDPDRCALCAAPWVLLCWLVIGAVLLACCGGCTQQDRAASGTGHTRRMMRQWTDPAGVTTTLEETWSETAEQSKTTSGFDPAITAGIQAGVGAVSAAARGDWSDALVKGAAAASLAYAAWQGSKAKGETKRADEHKEDAAEGWAKALQQVPAPRPPSA